jgi:hypothetical protein
MAALVLAGFSSSAEACSLGGFDQSDAKWTVEEIVDALPEVVLEGEIIQRDLLFGDSLDDATPKHAQMRVDQAWKGESAPIVALEFIENSSSCGAPPLPVGTHLRIRATPLAANVFPYGAGSDFLLQGPKMEQALRAYQRRTNAMQARAESGDHAERVAFADYLHRYGETHRAVDVYQSILRDQPKDLESYTALAVLQGETISLDDARETLARLRALAPQSEEWRGKLARTTFLATGVLSSDWKDWSRIENSRPCTVEGTDFDNANFDAARMHGCLFPGTATFHNASFKGADLRDSDFLVRADVKGALYDCVTRLPEWIDPVAAGMVNIEGQCHAQ